MVNLKHGLAREPGSRRLTKEYQAWSQMKTRCSNPKDERYKNYGGRDITYCERWEKFENFLADMGYAPTNLHTLGRKKNEGNYEPDNCEWQTKKDQARDRRPRGDGPKQRVVKIIRGIKL